jgi:hypothetical protein
VGQLKLRKAKLWLRGMIIYEIICLQKGSATFKLYLPLGGTKFELRALHWVGRLSTA